MSSGGLPKLLPCQAAPVAARPGQRSRPWILAPEQALGAPNALVNGVKLPPLACTRLASQAGRPLHSPSCQWIDLLMQPVALGQKTPPRMAAEHEPDSLDAPCSQQQSSRAHRRSHAHAGEGIAARSLQEVPSHKMMDVNTAGPRDTLSSPLAVACAQACELGIDAAGDRQPSVQAAPTIWTASWMNPPWSARALTTLTAMLPGGLQSTWARSAPTWLAWVCALLCAGPVPDWAELWQTHQSRCAAASPASPRRVQPAA